jgi:ADP-ribose pyrophosphatase
MGSRILAETPFLRLVDRDGWTYVERPNSSRGVVMIVPLTAERKLVFVQQMRIPVSGQAIEFPAGLIGDEPGHENEDQVSSARRELIEETGFEARALELVSSSATSPGMANELVHFVLAWDLVRVGAGGGVAGEKIVVHEVPLGDVHAWLRQRESAGLVIAAKVYAGLYFAHERWGR